MEEYNPEMLPISVEMSYVDDFFDEHFIQLTKGNYIENNVCKKLNENIALAEAVFENYVYFEQTDTSIDMTVLFLNVESIETELLIGSIPRQDDEVIITDFVADELGMSIGDTLQYNNEPIKVVGIVKTDYIEYNLKSKLHNGNSSPFLDYYVKYRYQVMYMQNTYLHDRIKTKNIRIELPMSDFSVSDREKMYLERTLFYDSESKLQDKYLVAGRLPEKENEVIVSEVFATNFLDYNIGDGFEERIYWFKNIYSECYNDCYSSMLNLYDYYKDGVVVVGIVSNFESEELCSEIYVEENMWFKIKDSYYDHYAANKIYIVENNDYESFVEVISSNGAIIEEPAILQIYEFAKIVSKIKTILYALLILVSILNVIMIITFIQISIRENKKNIGVLRALGVPMRETGSIFMIEFWGIYVVSVIMSIPVILYIQQMANRIYCMELVENPYNIIIWNSGVFIAVLIIEGIIDVLASNIPIRKWNSKSIIELVRND